MSTLPRHFLTEEEYLALDRAAERKSEYFDGEMVAMSGATFPHNVIVGNLAALLHGPARSRGCTVLTADMRVHIDASRTFAYPDLVVVCGKPALRDNDVLLNPSLVVEVLSPSTERYDRGRKFDAYRGLESLREYMLVSQDRTKVELYTRGEAGAWAYRVFERREDSIELTTVPAALPVGAVFERVDFSMAP